MASRSSSRDKSADSRAASGVGGADEAAWVTRAAEGDGEAYRFLVDRYQDQIYSVAFRLMKDGDAAGDVAQDAFVRAWRALPRFESRSKFSTWLYRIAINLCYDRLARRPGAAEVALEDLLETGQEPAAPSASGGQAALEESENQAAFAEALAALSETYRVPFVLRQIEERSYEEIAEALGITVNNAKVRVHRAREMMMAWLRRRGVL